MSRKRIRATGDAAVLSLPQEMLDEMGVSDGDEVDVSVEGRTLVFRAPDEAERARKIDAATNDVFERRRSAYEELAKGA